MGTAMKHPVPDRVKQFLTSGHSDAQLHLQCSSMVL